MFPTATKVHTLALITLALISSPAVAAESVDEAELNQLMAVLDKHTAIATETRMNADYIPGMVTVLHGDELEARGIRNLAKAMTLVPGFDVAINNSGAQGLLSRGLGSGYAPATAMIMVNGSPMVSTFAGQSSGVAAIPIEQVDRIEVIRGPGSAINGEFAYSGVINIITRKCNNRVYGSVGRFESYDGGVATAWTSDDREDFLSLNVAGATSNGADHYIGPDSFGNYGTTNEARESLSAFASASYDDFTLLAHIIKGGQGDFFGVMPSATMEESGHGLSQHQQVKTVEARFAREVNDDFSLHLKAGWQEQEMEQDPTYMVPEGFDPSLSQLPFLNAGNPYPEGILVGILARENKYFTAIDSTWSGWTGHKVLTGLSYSRSKMQDLWHEWNIDLTPPYPPTPLQRYSGAANLMVPEDPQRKVTSLSLQDEWTISDTIHLTFGLRYDHYSDVGDDLTPRLAGVWTPRPQHIFKAQYARAFRPPTFMELYGNESFVKGNPNITPETVDTVEIGYIFRNERRTAKATLFYSDNHDTIVSQINPVSGTMSYQNTAGAIQRGGEIEIREVLNRLLTLDANLSYVDTELVDNKATVPGTRNWLANAALIYSPVAWTTMALQYRYVGEQERKEIDSRPPAADYQVVDFTLSLFPLPGLTLRAGVKNLLDEDVLCASTPQSGIGYTQGYPNDLPTQDQSWWLQCSYEM